MKEFINNIIPNLKNASEKLNAEAILKNQQWVLVNEDGITTTTYIFRNNNELLIVVNGDVTSGTWEYITKDKLLIKIGDQMLMYRNQFVDDKLLALKKDGALGFNVFLNEKVIDEFVSNTLKIESHLKSFYEIEISNSNKDVDIQNSPSNKKESNDISPLFFIVFFGAILLLIILSYKLNQNKDNEYVVEEFVTEEASPVAEEVVTEEPDNNYIPPAVEESSYYQEEVPVIEEVAPDEHVYSY